MKHNVCTKNNRQIYPTTLKIYEIIQNKIKKLTADM